MAAPRTFSSEALREMRATGASLKDMAGHFGVAASTISRRLKEVDAEDFASGRRQPKQIEVDDRTTPPLPTYAGEYDVQAALLTNIKRAEELLTKDLSHQERVRVMGQIRANLLTLHTLQASSVREDAAEAVIEDVVAVMAEMEDEKRRWFESRLRDRRDLRRTVRGH